MADTPCRTKAISSAWAASPATTTSAGLERLPYTMAQHGTMSMNSNTGHERN